MGSKSLSPVRGRSMRMTRLDSCGRVVYGDASHAVSEGFVSVALTANTQDTDEINVPNAAGKICVFEPAETNLVGYGAEITFCEVDFELFTMVTGALPRLDAFGNVVGFDVITKAVKGNFALEVWTGSKAGDVCDDPNAQGAFGYTLLAWMYGGIVGDFTIENGAISFVITGANTREGNRWGIGPYAVVRDNLGAPSQLLAPVNKNSALLMELTTVEPPEAAIGLRPVLDPTSTPITDITATPAGLVVGFVTVPAATSPVWYDFGDDEWDYVAAPGAASHTYAEAGTYAVRASTNQIDWVEETVTITSP